ncbi:N-6 DNA methylase [Rippkaea orientalis PCC 8801]|uniref:site-specific DNA-methyltransferase (adenine-specific) n=1 Tax=Rippkaea orientalis (strain PCC 8801 / RF-1) TaxID=41431 RepID=B7K143_RIPO1|nr:class I SAM-dependent DNA methyltransferase [Rippkaea orientalis]ACK66238.1 N-6 DNA methylase [Rippkaea orientalis PCC 8801]
MAKQNGKTVQNNSNSDKSLESWIWDAACSIRGAQEAAKYKDFILPLIFTKRLCDVFDDELNRIAVKVKTREKAFKLVEMDQNLVRFYLPLKPDNPDDAVWSVIRQLSDKIGETLTGYLRDIAKANPLLKGIIDRVDFNATIHGERELDDDRLSNLIEKISEKRLGLKDVEPDIIGRSYEYLIRKFAESGKSAGEFYTPKEVGIIMAKIMQPQPGMAIYDPCCGSAGLLIKCQLVLAESQEKGEKYAPLQLYGQEYTGDTWAMANMNMIIHDMEGKIEIGDSFRFPKFKQGGNLAQFDRVVANPMWNQNWFTEQDYDGDEWGRFPQGAGFPGSKADWGWVQHIWASLQLHGQSAIVLDTGAASRGSGNANKDKEKEVRKWFVEKDIIEGVIYLPENLFYNTSAPGIILILNKAKSEARKHQLLLINASLEFAKGDPKNYISDQGINRIVTAFLNWEEQDKFSRIVSLEEIAKNDYNISPSRYIHVTEAEEFRPIGEILQELEELESQAEETNRVLMQVLSKFR